MTRQRHDVKTQITPRISPSRYDNQFIHNIRPSVLCTCLSFSFFSKGPTEGSDSPSTIQLQNASCLLWFIHEPSLWFSFFNICLQFIPLPYFKVAKTNRWCWTCSTATHTDGRTRGHTKLNLIFGWRFSTEARLSPAVWVRLHNMVIYIIILVISYW